jgi:hypothetical protein
MRVGTIARTSGAVVARARERAGHASPHGSAPPAVAFGMSGAAQVTLNEPLIDRFATYLTAPRDGAHRRNFAHSLCCSRITRTRTAHTSSKSHKQPLHTGLVSIPAVQRTGSGHGGDTRTRTALAHDSSRSIPHDLSPTPTLTTTTL